MVSGAEDTAISRPDKSPVLVDAREGETEQRSRQAGGEEAGERGAGRVLSGEQCPRLREASAKALRQEWASGRVEETRGGQG